MRRTRSARVALRLAIGIAALASVASLALAGTTGTWTPAGDGGSTSVAGVTVTLSGINPNSASLAATLDTTNYWTNPYGGAVTGGPSLDVTPTNVTQTVTFTFSKGVDNPVLHVERIGGVGTTGQSNSSSWTLTTAGVTMTRLSGNTPFAVTATNFQRTPNVAAAGRDCAATGTTGTGCGSIRFNGTNITSLTFTVTFVGSSPGPDSLEFAFSVPDTSVIIRKQSVNNTGTFAFTGSNGVGNPSLNTATTNPISSPSYTVLDHSQPITVTETVAGGFTLSSATCLDQNSSTVTSSLASNVLTIPSSSLRLAGQTITCTFTNTAVSDVSVSLAGLPTTATVGSPYSGTFTCTNAAAPFIAATGVTCAATGLPAGVTVTGCSPAVPVASLAAGATITCSVSGTPTTGGTATVNGTTSSTNEVNTANNTASTTISVAQSDMSINLSGLPTTGNLGVAYSGTFTCTAAASPSLAAANATCAVSGLPAGVTVTGCVPAVPVASLAAGATITCSVSGTPTATGASTVNGTTGATNDGVAANNTATRTVTINGADMTPDVSGLPSSAAVGTPYTGTVVCTNSATATASALSATCAVSGLPPGVTVGACTPVPPATVAAGATISCPVSGTPTTGGSFTVTATTGATNDTNGGTGTGGNNTATTTISTTQSDMSISLAGLPTSANVGVAYSGTFTCTAAASPSLPATNATCAVSGLPPGVTVTGCVPTVPVASLAAGASITCSVSGTPTATGASAVNGTTGATNDGIPANNTASATITVNGADMTPDVSGLPTTATVGTPYSGTIVCRNSATATASALNASCAVSGLPAGVTVGTCTPTPPATVAAGATISCPVSGTPTTGGSFTVTATTGATNDTNGGTGTGGNNTATTSIGVTRSDMSIDLTGLPTTASIGTAYSGTFTCTNAAAPAVGATNATCAVTGLPAGVTVTGCTPAVPVSTLAPSATITCSVSGTPTATGSSTVNGATGATNDDNAANNTATRTVTVTGADMTADLSGLPATATVGTAYTGTIVCRNSATATAAATNATCSVSGLPPGVTVGACTPVPPATVAIGGTISCPVSGTPTAGGTFTTTATTGATNDTNGGTGTGGNNTATKDVAVGSSDMSIDLSGLPNSGGVGQPYSGTYSCTNANAPAVTATAAACAISGLPAGLTASCTPTPPVSVAPGASINCTVTGTPTATGSSTATGTTGASNDPITANNTATRPIAIIAPTLSITKTSTTTSFSAAGVSIPYSFRVTNSGTVTITAPITVSDNRIASVSCPSLPVGGLAPAAFITCTGTYTTTQADLDAGGVTNIASASSGTTTSPTTSLTVPATQTRSLSIVKSTTSTTYSNTTTPVPYTFVVRNTGNVTITAAITVADSRIAAVSCPALPVGGLAPNATITCTGTYTPTQADLDAGSIVNTATATSGTTTSPPATHTLNGTQTRSLSIVKATTATSFSATGVGIPYTFTVTNTGNVTLTSAITVSDNRITSVSCPSLPTGLAPGASTTCTGTYTTTQADLDAGSIVNTATATSGTTTSAPTSHTLPANQTRALTVAKTSTTASFNAAGVAIPYSFRVTNSGNVTLAGPITVSDSRIASVSCPAVPVGGLAPGAFITCTGTYTTTQADVNSGGVTNTASATNGTTTSPTTSLTIPAVQTPALTVAKTSTTTSFNAPGVSIPYSFRVTNSGNVTLTSAITVADNRIASVSCPALPVGGLAPGAFITCTGSYTTTQADVDAGGVTNTASATSGTTTSPTTSLTVPSVRTRALTLTKAGAPATYSTTGAVITYTYVVRNTGNVTVTSAISVSDNRIASVSCPSLPVGGLAPNATLTCTATAVTTQADLDAGSITNTATATDGTTTSAPVTATVTATQTRALTVTKSTTTTSFSATGVVVTYSFLVRNTGNVTITSAITVSDSKIASVSCPTLPPGGLPPNAGTTCTGTYTTTQADLDAGSIVNTATATSGTTTSPPASHTLPASQTRALSLAKTASPTSFGAAGVTINYTYVVRNTGNVTIPAGPSITVSDDKIATVTCPNVPAGGLAPNATLTCTASAVTTQADVNAGSITNTATAQWDTTTSAPTSATVTANQAPALTIVKSTTATTYSFVGQPIAYSFRVTNTGNTTLTSAVTVSDSRIASVSCPSLPVGGLTPGSFITCTGTYSVTQADLNAGSIVNTASATSGTTTSPPTTHTLTGTQTRSLSLVKSTTTTSFAATGVAIAYSYAVTNTGNVTLTTAITVADDKIPTVTCPALPPGGLAPGSSITCTGSYSTTQADIDAGGVTNTATATSGTTNSAPQSVTVPATQTRALSIIKSSTTTSYNAAGQSIPYSFRVTNSGNTTLTSAVTVSDNRIASVSCPSLPVGGLAPGAFITCTGTYTTTQADVNAGSLTNTASATSGTTTSPTTSLTINASQAAALSIAKSTTTTAFSTVGATIPYSYRVTNTGNVTLTSAVTVADNRIASVSCPALPVGGLVPGAFITCTGSYTTTQADIDAGAVTNIATATSGTTTSPQATVTVPAVQTPSLRIVKSTTATTYVTPGTIIPYSFDVTNNGNTTLTASITVTDSKIGTVLCPPIGGGLAPGATITCTGSYTITQADLDGGNVINTAFAQSGTVQSPTVTYTLNGTQTPQLTIAKSSTTTNITTLGQSVPYSYRLTNTGNVTLTVNANVADSKIATVSCPAMPAGGLAPGSFVTCTATYTVTQADLDSGSVVNTAVATSGTPSVAVTSNTAALTIPVTQSPALTLTKSTTATSFSTVGQVVPYSFLVRNTGNVTITSAVTVSDDRIATVTCPSLPAGGLAPNATITCTGSYTVAQADLDAGSIVNNASARSGTTVSPTVTHTLNATTTQALALVKSSTATTFTAAGEVLNYTYVVRNAGTTTLPQTPAIAISDNKIPSVSCPALPAGGLAPNATITCTASYTVTQADMDAGFVTNIATATKGALASPSAQVTITGTQTRSLSVTKSTTTTTYAAAGTVVPYTFLVRNTGNVTLTTAITVTDTRIATVTCPALPAGGLVPNATITCTGSYTTTQADVNAGSVVNTATARSGTTTSPTDTHTLPASQTRSLSITKTPSPTTYAAAGVTVTYSYVVRNTGNVTVTQPITVADDRIATVTCPALPAGGLAPNATITCTASYTTTQADINAGSVTNTATATSGTTTSAPVTATITGTQTPRITLAKSTTAPAYSTVGTVIPYDFRVTNSGNVTITAAVTVTDNRIAAVSCPALPAGGLAPGGSITCTGSYTVTQADIDAGAVTNTAFAQSGPLTSSPPVTHTQNATQTRALTLVKSTTSTTYTAAGQTIPYSYVVTNSGNVTLTNAVTVTDNKIASVTCPALPAGGLAPGASITCTGTYTTTQTDVNLGSVTNIATARSGTTTSPNATVTVNATQTRSISLVKATATTSFSAAGVPIAYTYRVTNTGNVTLTTAVTVTDDKIATVTCPALPVGGLVPGAFITCSGSYTTTQADVNNGGVTNNATARSGTTTSPTATVTVPSNRNPALTVLKSASPTSFNAAGRVITYSYRVTNSGNVTHTAAITVADDKIPTVTCPALPVGGLAPGAFITCSATYTTTQADLDAGGVTNVASATSGTTTSPPTSVTVTGTRTPAISIAKTSTTTSFSAAGVAIAYSFRVTNSGNTTLTSAVTVTDDRIPSVSCPALPAGGLAPGAFITCTGTYTTTQANVDAGGVTNRAFATSGTLTSPTVALTIPATRTPGLTVVKSTTTTSVSAAGTVVPYSYLVTNSGNTTLTTAITVSDNKITTVSCPALPAGGLAPGGTITCTGTYVVTQADINAGGVTNTASARSGTTVSPTVSVTVPANRTPALSIVKSTTTTSFSTANTNITFSYRVTNTGNVTHTTAITVTDDKIPTVTCPALPAGGLAPGVAITCTGTYRTTQADVDAGGVTNTASARSGTTTSPTVSVTVPSVRNPALSIAKTSTSTSFSAAGVTLAYSYRVTNSGNTTITTPITVADDRIATVTCPALPAGGLAPGAFITCTASATTTQADVDAGGITNRASATSGTLTSPTVSLTIPATNTRSLAIAKSTTSTGFTAAGTVIPYSYRVTNTGNTTLIQPVTVTDDKIASVSCPALPAGGLTPGAFITCTGNYTTTQADMDAGRVTNRASARSGTTQSPTVSVTVNATQAPALTVVKTSTTTSFAAAGVNIAYSYQVTNSGNVTLTQAITVADNKITTVTCPALPAGGLAPGASITCTGTYRSTQADLDAGGVTNTATARSGTTSSPTVSLTIPAQQSPGIGIAKSTAATAYAAVGEAVTYSYRVTNTGNTTIRTAVTVTDDKIASVTCPALPAAGLAPAAYITCTGSYTVTQADLDAGSLTNMATARSGTLTSPTVSVTINATQTRSISLVKASTSTGYRAVGVVLPYTYTVRNTGNVTLTGTVTVTDDKIPTVTCPALPVGGLAPNATITCTGSYTTTATDLYNAEVTNIAQATLGTLTSAPVTLTIATNFRPNFTVTKTTTSPIVTFNNDGSYSTSFVITIENTGDVDLTDVQATDDFLASLPAGSSLTSLTLGSATSSIRGPVTLQPAFAAAAPNATLFPAPGIPLDVGERVTLTFDTTFTLGAATVAQNLENRVVATTVFNRGMITAASVSRSAQAPVRVEPGVPFAVQKTTTKTEVVAGELVPYTITVRNTFRLARPDVSIVDLLPPGFKYRDGSATVDGVPREPAKNGRELTWSGILVPANGFVTLRLILVVGSGVRPGEYHNDAYAKNFLGEVMSPVARATVRVTGDPTFDCTDIIGKVFDDRNQNGVQDAGERGIANVRVATVRGELISTDSEGRYHITCADVPESDRGTNYILKLDERTLPTGYRVTTENPRVIRITRGKMAKINFGATLARTAQLDLMDAAFVAGKTELMPEWAAHFDHVIGVLRAEKTVLKVTYRRRGSEDAGLAETRLRAIEALVRSGWQSAGNPWRLNIETQVLFERRAAR